MRYGCLYIPHFPAWSFRYGPHEAGPCIVVQGGQVCAATRRLRRQGIVAGIAASRARELAPEASLKTRAPELEGAVWQDVLARLFAHTPRIETNGLGLAFFEPFPDPGSFSDLASRLPAQLALAPTRPLARLAACRTAPGNMLRLDSASVKTFLGRFETQALAELGFEEAFTERLQLFGYADLQAARTLSEKHLTDQFGASGARLYRMLHAAGRDRVAPYVPPPTLEDTYLFDWPTRDLSNVVAALEHLTTSLTERLDGRTCQRVEIEMHLRTSDEPLLGARTLLEPTQSCATLTRAARRLAKPLLQPSHEVTRAGLRLSALNTAPAEQGALFQEKPAVLKALQAVQRQHPGTLLQATTDPHAVFGEDRFALEPIDELPAPTAPSPSA